MRLQDDKFKQSRDKVRKFLKLTQLCIGGQTRKKIGALVTNGVKEAPLMDWEVDAVDKALLEVIEAAQEFRDILYLNKTEDEK